MLKEELEKIYLNEKAFPFVLEQLRKNDLSTEMTSLFLNSAVKIWTYAPKGISEIDLTEFQYGGKYKSNPVEEYIEIVEYHLEEDKDYNWIVIDNTTLTEYTLEQNTIEGSTPFYYNDSVLHLFKSNAKPHNNIKNTFTFGGAYPFIGFITKMTASIEDDIKSNIVSKESIEYLVKNIKLLIIGAYDEESYLVVEIE